MSAAGGGASRGGDATGGASRGSDATGGASRGGERRAAALRDALLRFLGREESASARGLADTHGLPLALRVEAGDAIDDVRLISWDPERGELKLRAPRNDSRFRPGDRLRLGDGLSPADAPEVDFVSYDEETGLLVASAPRWNGNRARLDEALAGDGELALDVSGGGMEERFRAVVADIFASRLPHDAALVALLERAADALDAAPRSDAAGPEKERGRAARESASDEEDAAAAEESARKMAARGVALNDAQRRAFVAAWAAEPFALVQGPPGTGKTFLLGLLLDALAWRRERLLVAAGTNLAVNNALVAAVEAARRAGAKPPRIVRFRPRPADRETLRAAGIEIAQRMSDVALLPGQGVVVGMTTHGAAALADECFDRVFLDEAAQVTVAHALPALRRAPRGALFGDDAQLGPVLAAEHDDGPAARSIFALLRGAAPATMLDETYRLNDDLCAFPSRVFYDGRLRPAPGVGARRLALRAAGDVVDQVLDPERGAVFVAVDHVGRRHWSPEEAEAAATIAAALIERAGLAADQLAVVAPFRRQNAAIERLLRRRLGKGAPLPVVDTVERIQGQEREAVVLSLACSDPEALRARTDFFFSPLRLNVALTRARTKLVVLGSPRLLRLIPSDLAGLRRVDIFHRLFAELPTIAWPAANAPSSAPRKAPRSEKRRR